MAAGEEGERRQERDGDRKGAGMVEEMQLRCGAR